MHMRARVTLPTGSTVTMSLTTPKMLVEVVELLQCRSRAELVRCAEALDDVSFDLIYKLARNKYPNAISYERVERLHQWLVDNPPIEEAVE